MYNALCCRGLQFGVVWIVYTPDDVRLRHFKRREDNLTSYKWLQHNGETFGQLRITDGGTEAHAIITLARVGGGYSSLSVCVCVCVLVCYHKNAV